MNFFLSNINFLYSLKFCRCMKTKSSKNVSSMILNLKIEYKKIYDRNVTTFCCHADIIHLF